MSEGLEWGIDSDRVALVGDSAGANLALAVCLTLRDSGSPQPRGAALLYGGYSLDFDTASQRAYGSGAYLLGTAEMQRYWNEYLRDQTARESAGGSNARES